MKLQIRLSLLLFTYSLKMSRCLVNNVDKKNLRVFLRLSIYCDCQFLRIVEEFAEQIKLTTENKLLNRLKIIF
jgi:hypothetical protein